MYVVKAFVDMMWVTLKWCPSLDDAQLFQDGFWLNMPEIITEIEYRGF